jgi:hypothetical protein
MWIASTFTEITAEKIGDCFSGGDGQDWQSFVRALVLIELDALGVAHPFDVRQPRVGGGPDGGVDLRYVPAPGTLSKQGYIVPETSAPLWFSCKASASWLDLVLTDLDWRKDASRAEAKRVAEHLDTSPAARFVIVTSAGGDLDGKRRKAKKFFGETARARIEHCLQQSDPTYATRAFGAQITLVSAVQIQQFLHQSRPFSLSPTWLRALGVREITGWESVEELAKRFTKGGRKSNALFVDDESRVAARAAIADATENGGLLVVVGPPGIGKTRAVYEALNQRTREQRELVTAFYGPRPELLNEALREQALQCSNIALIVDDVGVTELSRLLDALIRDERQGKRTSVVLVVSAPESAVSNALQSLNATAGAAIELVAIKPLGERERRRLLSEEVGGTRGRTIDEPSLEQLAKLSHGYPWFAVLLAAQRETPRTVREAIERAMTDDVAQRETYWAALLLAVMMRDATLSSIEFEQRRCLASSLGVAEWNQLSAAVKHLRAKAIVRPHETPDGEQAISYVSPAIFAREVIRRELIEDPAKLRALRECFARGLERVLDAAEAYELTDEERRTLAENIVRSMDARASTVDALADSDAPASKLLRQLALAAPARTASWLAAIVEQATDAQLVARDARLLTTIAALTIAWRRDAQVFDVVEPALRRLAVFDETPFLNNAKHQWVRLFAEEPDPARPIEPRIERFEAVVRSGSTRERILATDVCFAWTANDNYLRAWSSSNMNDALIAARSEAQRRVVDCFLLLLSDSTPAVSAAARARLNDILGARRTTNPWLARVSKQLADRVMAWSEAQRSALLAALGSRQGERGYPTDDPAAIATLEAALRPQTRSERFRAVAQRVRRDPLRNKLDHEIESALDELITTDATEFADELRWTDADGETLGGRRLVYALGLRDQTGACAERVVRYARESPGSRVPALYFLGREDGGTPLTAIDATIRDWSEGAMVLARLTYLAQSRIDSEIRVEWFVSAARSSAPDHWFEQFERCAALHNAGASAQAAIIDALLDGQSATRATIVVQLCAARTTAEDSPRIKRALEALSLARRWPPNARMDWLAVVLRLVEEDSAWAAKHVVSVAERDAFDVPAPPIELALREWPEAHGDALWDAIALAYRQDTALQLSWALRDATLVAQWTPRVLAWVEADRQRAVWVTTWLSVVDPKHEELLAGLAQRLSEDERFMNELRSSIEAVIVVNQHRLAGEPRAVLDRHIARCAVGNPAWAARVRERLEASDKPERAA